MSSGPSLRGGVPRFLPLIAKRFLLSNQRDGFLSFISWVSTLGVALGVMALVVVTSVVNGFKRQLETTITGMNGDVILYTRGNPIPDGPDIERRVKELIPRVSAVTSSFITELMVSGPKSVAGAVLEGFDPLTLGQVTHIPQRVKSGRMPVVLGEIALGSALADRVGAKVGSSIRLVAPFVGASTETREGAGAEDDASARPAKFQDMNVVGIIEMGMHQYDSKFVFATLESVQSFLGYRGAVTSFKLRLREGSTLQHAVDAARKLGDHFGYPFRAKDWAQLNRNLLYAIELEKVVLSIILTAIVLVAAFNIVSTLMMMIHDKGADIAILKAMGMRSRQAWLLFMSMGGAIGAVGIVSGGLGGLALNASLKHFKWIELPADVYYINFLPVIERWGELAAIFGATLILCWVAALIPAQIVARKGILDGIRRE